MGLSNSDYKPKQVLFTLKQAEPVKLSHSEGKTIFWPTFASLKKKRLRDLTAKLCFSVNSRRENRTEVTVTDMRGSGTAVSEIPTSPLMTSLFGSN